MTTTPAPLVTREALRAFTRQLVECYASKKVILYSCGEAFGYGSLARGAGPPKSVSMACWRGLTALALVGGNGSPPCPKSLTQQLISLIPAI